MKCFKEVLTTSKDAFKSNYPACGASISWLKIPLTCFNLYTCRFDLGWVHALVCLILTPFKRIGSC